MFNLFKNKTKKEIAIKKFQKLGLTLEESEYLIWDAAMNEFLDEKKIEEAYKTTGFNDTIDMLLNGKSPIKDIAYTGLIAKKMGKDFNEISMLRFTVFHYIEENNLDNSLFEEIFLKMLNKIDVENNITPIINYLFEKGWISSNDNNIQIETINKMVDTAGVEQVLANYQMILSDAEGWHMQVYSPQSQLQKITSLSLNWIGGKLENIKNEILNQNIDPFDMEINYNIYVDKVYNVLKESESSEDFPILDDDYRIDVAGRFIQYLIEDKRLTIINSRINNIDEIYHVIEKLNIAKLDYSDIEDVYYSYLNDVYKLFFEMKNERKFSLIFNDKKDLQVALDLVKYTLGLTTDMREKKFKAMNINTLLLGFSKMSFTNFINQYELNNKEIEAAYEWLYEQEERYNEDENEEKIVDFSNYNLGITNILDVLLVTVTKENLNEKIIDEEDEFEKLLNTMYDEEYIEDKLEEFNYTLPININQRIKFIQVFGNDGHVWLMFQVPERDTPEEDTKAIAYLVNTMKENDFVQDLNKMGIEISIQIITNDQQNVATSNIKFDNE